MRRKKEIVVERIEESKKIYALLPLFIDSVAVLLSVKMLLSKKALV
jgi:hypothetical protein